MNDDHEIAQLRVPPHSLEAESSVLGSLLLDPAAWDRIDGKLDEADFYRNEHRLVFSAIARLSRASKPADTVTTYTELERMGRAQDAGGLPYLNALAQYVPSASSILRYAEIVREHATRRRLITAADEIAAAAFAGQTSVADLVDQAQQKILLLNADTAQPVEWLGIHEGMIQHTELLEQRREGKLAAWPTGLSDLDEYLEGGLRPGELVIVGARPSMGKTALGLSMSMHLARDRAVALLSMEMTYAEILDRITSMLGHVSLSSVKRPATGNGLNWSSVLEGVDRAKPLRFRMNQKGGLNINQVRTLARNLQRADGLEVLVVDYIGLMTGLDAKATRNTQLGEVSRGLKSLAKELGICVVCLAQLNRKAEERADQMPQMSDLRDSGEIEQDADVILFIKRPIMSNPDLGPDWQHYAKLSVAKNRQGRCGYIDLSYIGERTQFTGWSGEAPSKKVLSKHGGGGL